MAAPYKKGIEYIYWDFNTDDKVMNDLIMEFSDHTCTTILMQLKKLIGCGEGYFAPWSEKEIKRFAYYNHIAGKEQLINDIVTQLLNTGYFDQQLFNTYGILTSKSIQEHFLHVCKRRKFMHAMNTDFMCDGILSKYERIVENLSKSKKETEAPQPEKEEKVVSDGQNDTASILQTLNGVNVYNNPSNGIQEPPLLNTPFPQDRIGKDRIGKDNILLNFEQNFTSPEVSVSEIQKISHETLENFENQGKTKEEPPPDPTEPPPEKEKSSGGAKKKPLHPARSSILDAWQKKFGLVYTQSKENNTGINHIIRYLENLARSRGHPVDSSGEVPPDETAMLFQGVLDKWETLDDFYSKQISFQSIAKNFENILNQIRDRANGNNNGKKTSSKLHQNGSGSSSGSGSGKRFPGT